jgi:tetratricopeptide (TPR) repeat protein
VAQRRQPQGAVHTIDGEYVRTSVGTAHWSMARSLLGAIRPRSRSDGFVRLWYRAVAARFASAGLFGGAQHALDRGLELLPHDPVLLFYAGAMHETLASARFQSVARSLIARQQRFPSPRDELRDAEKLLGASVKAEGPVEAHLRYARVRGLLGRHEDAVARLRRVAPQLDARRLQYFAALFLGSEEDALGHVGAARDAFERAAALYPTAQSPVLALGALFRRAGDRKAVLEALSRLEALPADRADREDPWTDYYRSFAFDADQQLAAVRAWVDRELR